MKILKLTALLAFIIILGNLAHADSAYNRIKVSGNFAGFAKQISGNLEASVKNQTVKSGSSYYIPEIRISTSVRGIGRVKLTFDRKRKTTAQKVGFISANNSYADKIDISLFKGSVTNKNRRTPASGSIYKNRNGKRILLLNFAGRRFGKSKENAYSLEVDLNNFASVKTAKLSKSPISREMSCGAGATIVNNWGLVQNLDEVSVMDTANRKILEIRLFADQEWFTRFGSDSNAQMLTFLNSAETIYEEQLSVIFDVISAETYTSNPGTLNTTASETLLENFGAILAADVVRSTADILHLFSGKDLDGSTLGIAYIGSVCFSAGPEFKTGLSQYHTASSTYLIFAHELGHNFGADHDSATLPQTLMFPSLNLSANRFSASSVADINGYITSNGACLANTVVSVTATPVVSATSTPNNTPVATNTPLPVPTVGPTETPEVLPPGTLPASAAIEAFKSGKLFAAAVYDLDEDEVYSDISVQLLFRAKAKGAKQVLKNLSTDDEGAVYFKPKKNGLYSFKTGNLSSRELKFKKK